MWFKGPEGLAPGHTAVVQYLAEHGAVLKQNDYGDTPLEVQLDKRMALGSSV